MKKVFLLILALVMLALPVTAAGVTLQGSGTTSQEGNKLTTNLVLDREGLLEQVDRAYLETLYQSFAEEHGFTPILCTVPSFEGMYPDAFAGMLYDKMGYPADGILYLVSLTEGEWYILTNGECYYRIPDHISQRMGEILVEYLRDGEYFEAFLQFPELAKEAYLAGETGHKSVLEKPKNYGKTIAICMAVGLAIGGIAAGIMAAQMKSVKPQKDADSYVRQGSMSMRSSRDIFLYSNVSRTPKPQNTSSGRSGGGSRGGAGGRI